MAKKTSTEHTSKWRHSSPVNWSGGTRQTCSPATSSQLGHWVTGCTTNLWRTPVCSTSILPASFQSTPSVRTTIISFQKDHTTSSKLTTIRRAKLESLSPKYTPQNGLNKWREEEMAPAEDIQIILILKSFSTSCQFTSPTNAFKWFLTTSCSFIIKVQEPLTTTGTKTRVICTWISSKASRLTCLATSSIIFSKMSLK